MKFIDKATVKVKAGNGGRGKSSFRRERFVSKGGPDGGDGGDGGDVIFQANHNLNTLAEFRMQKNIKAENGEPGKNKKQHGKNGQDEVLDVPIGTIIYEGELQLVDLTENGQKFVAAQGGKGGFGNAHFKSSVRQAPEVAELGEPGENKEITLELKLLAEVGLVGLPNAGKSTLLSIVSNAKPEIADYPFTTLTPNLGVVDIGTDSILFADIPGLIEGASEGKGLGDEFLRHVERTRVLLHLIDATSEDVTDSYRVIQKELATYRTDLSTKIQIVVLTKNDALGPPELKEKIKKLEEASKSPVLTVSAVKKEGLRELLNATLKQLKTARKQAEEHAETVEKAQSRTEVPAGRSGAGEVPTLTLADDPKAWWIEEKSQNHFVVHGQQIERFAVRTDFRTTPGQDRLRNIMKRWGIVRELENRHKMKAGDTVEIAGKSLKW